MTQRIELVSLEQVQIRAHVAMLLADERQAAANKESQASHEQWCFARRALLAANDAVTEARKQRAGRVL